MRRLVGFGFWASAASIAIWALALAENASALPSNCSLASGTVTCTFAETGAAQNFAVPAGVQSITVDAFGAQGGAGSCCSPHIAGGDGAHVHATLPVTPGATLEVLVGGAGGGSGAQSGGFNGGGGVPCTSGSPFIGGGGGGASDVRVSPYGLADRLVVAGGGGGGGGNGVGTGIGGSGGAAGGAGGPSGGSGTIGTNLNASVTGGGPGTAGTGSAGAGGTGGTSTGGDDNGEGGGDGSVGQGGLPGVSSACSGSVVDVAGGWGGGGGGGYYGGGGGGQGGDNTADLGAGGGGGAGGSSFIETPATGKSTTDGVRAGNGLVKIKYAVSAPQITSTASAAFKSGDTGSFTITTTGVPTPTLSEAGALPGGLTFSDNGNGTATLAGTPAAGTGGSYPITIKAANGISPSASQNFTLTVESPPSVSIAAPANGAIYALGQVVDSSFSCSDGAGGPGIASCVDQSGRGSGAALDTASIGPHSFTVTATSSDGQTGAATVSYTVAAAPGGGAQKPSLSHLKVRPHRFRASTKGKAIVAKVESGAKITYRDSMAAVTTFRVYRKSRHGKWVYVGKFRHHDVAGTNRLRFTGRVGGRALKPGTYKLKAAASTGGRKSSTLKASFVILPPPPVCSDPDHDGDCDAPGQV
jgi:hypothetical protein